MIEFLTANRRRSYPLADVWQTGTDVRWTRLLVDAAIGMTGEPGAGIPRLLSASRTASGLVLSVGHTAGNALDLTITASDLVGAFPTVFARSSAFIVFLTVSAADARSLLTASTAPATATPGIPFALKCVSFANRRVTAVKSYSPTLCTTPVFVGTEEPVRTVTGGDVIFGSKDGIDVDRTEMSPITGSLLRVSAIAAPAETTTPDTAVDLMIRSDDCVTVEALPGVKAVPNGSGGYTPVARTASEPDGLGILGGGLIILGQKCKPCCQCEDYENAVNALRPGETGASTVQGILEAAHSQYTTALAAFQRYKTAAEAAINDYTNVHLTATGIASGGLYSGATTASGLRKRVAITMTLANMTLQTLSVNAPQAGLFSVPGFTAVSLSWRTAGQNPRAGTSIPAVSPHWSLAPGDTLVVVGTYATTGTNNEAVVPATATASVLLKLPGKQQTTKTETVK